MPEETKLQKLNKKLAKWTDIKDYTIYSNIANAEFTDPYSKQHAYSLLFTNSLDVCFKWLVPKLVSGDLHIEWYTTDEDTAVTIKRGTDTISFVCQSNPALALCLAIEKLIDKGGRMKEEGVK